MADQLSLDIIKAHIATVDNKMDRARAPATAHTIHELWEDVRRILLAILDAIPVTEA